MAALLVNKQLLTRLEVLVTLPDNRDKSSLVPRPSPPPVSDHLQKQIKN